MKILWKTVLMLWLMLMIYQGKTASTTTTKISEGKNISPYSGYQVTAGGANQTAPGGEIALIEPLPRNSSLTAEQSPCGGYPKGLSHLLVSPGLKTIVQWRTKVPNLNGTCRFRLSNGVDGEKDFVLLLPDDNSTDIGGKFACGRYANSIETKIIRLPEDMSCEKCTLQLSYFTPKGVSYSCADITLMSDKIAPCMGRCQNGGVCSNGVCVCIEPYHGTYCEYLDTQEEKKGGYFWIIVILLLLLIAAIFAVAYYINQRKMSRPLPPPIKDHHIEQRKEQVKPAKREPIGYEEQKSEPGEPVYMEEPSQSLHQEEDFEAIDHQGREPEDEGPPNTCDNGHELKWNTSGRGYPSNSYPCVFCQQIKDCNRGRWCCERCKYNICPECKPVEEEEPEQDIDPLSEYCPHGHPLAISTDDEGYVGGYYMCRSCNKVNPCSAPRWNCGQCNYDICTECKPVPFEEQKASPEPEPEPASKESAISPKFKIERVVESKQIEEARGFRRVRAGGKVTWNQTHFIFAIDCSGSMKGPRWNSVKIGYKKCIEQLAKMDEIVISTFTFDEKPNPFAKEKTPSEALKSAGDLPFTGKGTNYKRALEYIISLITRSLNPDFLNCIIFLSDGLGGYPEDTIEQIIALRDSGQKILLYTVACVTQEDDDMLKMVESLNGEHYKFLNAEAAKRIFLQILGV